MLVRLRILGITIASAGLLLFVLCLGTQNLSTRNKLKLGIGTSAPIPTGFTIGISIIFGVVSGGTTVALILPIKQKKF